MMPSTCLTERFLALATRAACSLALATVMWGSRPDADAVTASTGTGVLSSSPFNSRYDATRSATASRSLGLDGPRLLPPLLVGSYPSPAADGRGWKYFGMACP